MIYSSRKLSDVLLKKPAIQSSPPRIQSSSSPSNSKTPPSSYRASLLRKLLSSVSPENAESAATSPSKLSQQEVHKKEQSPTVKRSSQRNVLSDRSSTTVPAVSMSDVVLSGEESTTSATLSLFPSAFIEDDSSAVCSEPPPLEVGGERSDYDGMPDLEVHDQARSKRSHTPHHPVSSVEQRGHTRSSVRDGSNEKLLEYALSLKPKPASIGRGRALMELIQRQSREVASSATYPIVSASSAESLTVTASSAIHSTVTASSAESLTVTASSETHSTVTASSAVHPTVSTADQSGDSHSSAESDSCVLRVGPPRLESDDTVISDTLPACATRPIELSTMDDTQTSITEQALDPVDAMVTDWDHMSQPDLSSTEDIVTSRSPGPDRLPSVGPSLTPESASNASAVVVSAPKEHCPDEDVGTSDVTRPTEFLSRDGEVTSDTELSPDYINQSDLHSVGDTGTSHVARPNERFSEDNFSPEEQVTSDAMTGGDTNPEEANDAATRDATRPTELSPGDGTATSDTEEIPVVSGSTLRLEQWVLDHDAVSSSEDDTTVSLVPKFEESSAPNIATSTVVTRPTELVAEGVTETSDVTRPVKLFTGDSDETSDSESDTELSVVDGALEQPAVNGKELARPAEPSTMDGTETSIVESQSPDIDMSQPEQPFVDYIITDDTPRLDELSRVTDLAANLFPSSEESVTVDDDLSTGVELLGRLTALYECDATRPTELLIEDGVQTSSVEDFPGVDGVVTRPEQCELDGNATSDTSSSEEVSAEDGTMLSAGSKPREPVTTDDASGGVTRPSELTAVTDAFASDAVILCSPVEDTASSEVTREEFSSATRPTELLTGDGAETSNAVSPLEDSIGTGPGALSVRDTASGHVTRPVLATDSTLLPSDLLLLPPKFFETSHIELPRLTLPRDVFSASQIVECESNTPLTEGEMSNSQLTNEEHSLSTDGLLGDEGGVPSDPVGVTPQNRTADSAVTHPVEKPVSSGKSGRRIKMAVVFPSTPSTPHTPTPTRSLFTLPTGPPITSFVTTPNTLPTGPPITLPTPPHSAQDSDRATLDTVTDRESVHSPVSDKSSAGDGGVETGGGGVETGGGGVETGGGGVETGDGGVETGDGGVETGDGGVETGDGGVETGDGGVETGDGGVETGDGVCGVGDRRVGTVEGDIPALESVHGDSSDEGSRYMYMGRSQGEVEQSIATYQRNTRRWQVGVAC